MLTSDSSRNTFTGPGGRTAGKSATGGLLEDAPALCLSGGGYRAMLFHLGALWRINDAGLLRTLKRISSVSGGSITAGVLALHWKELQFSDEGRATNFQGHIVAPLRRLAAHTIDVAAVLVGAALPIVDASHRVIAAYTKHLFG